MSNQYTLKCIVKFIVNGDCVHNCDVTDDVTLDIDSRLEKTVSDLEINHFIGLRLQLFYRFCYLTIQKPIMSPVLSGIRLSVKTIKTVFQE